MKKCVEAFVTVEYALLITVIFMIYSFLAGIGVYMYNQCILKTNVRILALEGMKLSTLESKQKITELRHKEAELYNEKYLFCEQMSMTYNINGNNICIKGEGNMENFTAVFGIGEEKWILQDSCEVTAVNPADIMRLCKRLLTLGEEVLKEEGTSDE